jgi:DNA polymerase III alpha subunit
MVRVSSKAVRANSIQALAACGAMDSFKISRKLMFLYCSDYRKKLQVWLKKHDPSQETFVYPWPKDEDWAVEEVYALEQYYLGESFICKPAVAYGTFFKEDHKVVADIRKSKDKSNINSFKGIVRDFFEFRVKKEKSKYYGMPMIKASLEDRFGDQVTCTIFPDRWQTVQDRIKQINKKAEFDIGIALHFSGNTNNYEDDMGIILDTLFNIAAPPALPADLKPKKINLKEAKAKLAEPNPKDSMWEKTKDPKDLFQEIEDDLYDRGLIDLDTDEDDN